MDRELHRQGTHPLRRRRSVAVAAALAVAVSCGIRHDHRRLPVDGRRVHMVRAGEGRPVVVFEAGLGGSIESWSEVFPRVAAFTRVVAYDRAGLGRSDPGPKPRTAGALVEELDRILAASGERGPFVLVGHSFGGALARLFASRRPDEVAGLVFVDATHEDFPSREILLRRSGDRQRLQSVLLLEREAVRDEWNWMDASLEEIRHATALPAVPTIVLSAGRFEGPPELRELWLEFQDDLAGRFPGTVQHIAEKSGHAIPFEDPDAVVAAVREVVEAVRAGRSSVSAAGPSRARGRP